MSVPFLVKIDKAFTISVGSSLQALVCLSHLMSSEAEGSTKIRMYAKLAEGQVKALGKLMRPMLWSDMVPVDSEVEDGGISACSRPTFAQATL
jgi:hypothetical protein